MDWDTLLAPRPIIIALANLERGIEELPVVIVFDNSDLGRSFRLEAVYREGQRIAP